MEHVRFIPDGDWNCECDELPGFVAHTSNLGTELTWREGARYAWNNEEKRYESLFPPERLIYRYSNGMWLEMELPSGPSYVGSAFPAG